MAEPTYISLNPVNMITIVIMAAVGIMALGLLAAALQTFRAE